MRLKLCLLLVFMITYSWSQTTKTFGSSGTFAVPSGVTSINVQAWGGGGSGGGASGSPLLLGRGAAGGGGGAYASGPVSVTSGTTLNVVVASQTAGTTGTGTAGGNSTITGFESSILAAGGSGGAANNAGGTPLGGTGGTTAASAGTTKLAGSNGGNGNSWNLLGLLLSSGPGGAGANNGGAGGAAVSGLILSNAAGNAGSTPGGAGSGAINSALGAPYTGGAGAAGQVIISYTCPTYSITSTTATNVCSTSGTTSTVTLTSGAGALPVGNYVVTYNRSSPAATALTANLVVTTAGTGNFTATGLSTAGTSTITITKLTSETCSSNITTNNTATITIAPATVGGTVSGGTSICTGNTSGLLTLSGNVGTVVKWQFAVSPFSTWTDVSNPTTANTYTSVSLTATTQFRAVIIGICGTANSGTTTVTVNPVPTITLTENSIDICFQDNSSGTPITGVFEGLTGSPTTYSIVWNPSPANNFVAVTDAALSGNNFYFDVPAGLAVGTYTGTITVKNAAGCVSLGVPISINIKESPTITTTGVATGVNTSASAQTSSLPYSATTGNPTKYSIDWDAAANSALLSDQGNTVFSFAANGGNINTIQIPANVPAGTYSGLITIAGEACSHTVPISIVISNPAPTINLSATADDICSQSSSVVTILGYNTPTANPTTYSIVWNPSPANSFTAVTNDALPASPIDIVVPGGTVPGTYTGTLTVKNANGDTSPGYTFTITVFQSSTITSSGTLNPIFTSSSSQNATLVYSATSGSPNKYHIDWADNTFLADQPTTLESFSASGGSLHSITIAANVPAGTYTGTFFISNQNCEKSYPISIVISNPTPTIELAAATENVCIVNNVAPEQTTLSYSATTGNPTTYSIAWDSSPTNNFVDVTDASLPNSPITIAVPSDIFTGTYTGTLTVKNSGSTVSSDYEFTVTVANTPGLYINGEAIISPLTTSSSPQIATLEYAQVTGALPATYNIDWDAAANTALLQDQPNTAWTFEPIGDIINTIAISANVPPGTYYGTMFLNTNTCTGSVPVSIVINDPAPTINLAKTAATVCSHTNESTTTLNYSATTGNPTTYSILWDSSPANNFVAVTDAALPASPITIVIPAGTVAESYTGNLTVKNANGDVSTNSIFTVKVIQGVALTSTQIIDPITTSSSPQTATLQYSAALGIPNKYGIDWDDNTFLGDQPITLFTFSESGGLLNTITISANVPPGTYTGTFFIYGQTCQESFPISIVISSPVPTIDLATTAESRCSDPIETTGTTLEYSTTTGGPVTYSIIWDSSPANNFAYVIDESLPASPIIISIPAGTAPQTYTGNLVVKSVDNVSSNHVFSLKIIQCDNINSTGITDPLSAKNIVAGTSPNQVDSTSTTDSASAENPVVVSVLNKVIDINTFNQNIDKVFIYDVSGTLIYKKDSVENPSLTIDNLRSGNQVLVVKVLLKNSFVKTNKIIY